MKVKSIMIEAHQHPYQRTSNDTRQRIISAMQAGGDQDLVSRILNVKPWTVRRVMLKFYATGETDKGKHGDHKGKMLTEAHCAYLRDLMAEDATISLARMRDQLKIVDGVQVSLTTIHNAIKGFAYSFKEKTGASSCDSSADGRTKSLQPMVDGFSYRAQKHRVLGRGWVYGHFASKPWPRTEESACSPSCPKHPLSQYYGDGCHLPLRSRPL